ncbi:hypothetical protein CONLIGDRAFT_680782 [Coniochaeta ligniaria NRRL 30616]|uniref:Rhomboid family membrane protein n=1 Tax=Coniochaeta ligniaria NRRL 30616 TaxID=1408157 RepID=A0A1J7IS13_9PEZI|nr:hypothetical protein CONLIGDRAFT_680782 [Coniochaeta ligniaria NRRL 30616]
MADSQSPVAPSAQPPSPPQAPAQPPSPPVEEIQFYGTPPVLHYGAIGASILGPIAFLLPSGRKNLTSQLQNMLLATGSFWGFNQLAYDYSGKSIVQRSNERYSKIFSSMDQGLPTEKARQVKAQLEAQRAQLKQDATARQEAERVRREDEESRKRGLLTRVWMGGEGEDWKQRRIEEDKKALESGKGYGDIIMDQIWDVWNQTTGKEKKDEKVGDAASQSPKKEGNDGTGEKTS